MYFPILLLAFLLFFLKDFYKESDIKIVDPFSFKSKYERISIRNQTEIFYWMFESQSGNSDDPVIFWFNGGPGCSSMFGLFVENGPFKFDEDKEVIVKNPYSWNLNATMVYVDQPVGTGFSYAYPDQMVTNRDQLLKDFDTFIRKWRLSNQKFNNNDVYLSGESYAGVYIPLFANHILDNIKEINLKGILIGNGFYDYYQYTKSYIDYGYSLGYIDGIQKDKLHLQLPQCKEDLKNNKSDTCDYIYGAITSSINDYDIMLINPYYVIDYKYNYIYPKVSQLLSQYLNRKDIQEKLNVYQYKYELFMTNSVKI